MPFSFRRAAVRIRCLDSHAMVLESSQLRSVIHRERLRTDRSGLPMALLVFDFAPLTITRRDHFRILSIARRRLWATDSIGFLTQHTLAVVLPNTKSSGARKVNDDLEERFSSRGFPSEGEIFVYPWVESQRGSARPHDDPIDHGEQRLDLLFAQALPWWKRGVDVTGASVGLALAVPVLVVAGTAIKLTSPGPIFFSQMRNGLGGRPFPMHKLRTMHVGAEAEQASLRAMSAQDGPAFRIKNDPRVTPVGRFLRRISLDEIPQLWNVLMGHMSLVGPRPLPCDETEACENWQKRRLDVTPGLTCIWQVHGRGRVSFDEWMRMDLHYIDNGRWWHDLTLIVKTVPSLVLNKEV